MKGTMIEYEDYNYLVILVSRDNFYGRQKVYHVLTNNPKWCGSLIPTICGYPEVMSKGERDVLCKRNPSIENALKPYYTVDFIEKATYEKYDLSEVLPFKVDQDCFYEFVYTEPYDD